MDALVSDTSVLIDIERCGLEPLAFEFGRVLAVPDLLYDKELSGHGGERWLELGLQIVHLNEEQLSATQALYAQENSVSVIDCSALILAETNDWILMSGDRSLRAIAELRDVQCHGILWLFDEIERAGHNPGVLAKSLETLLAHPRCRLPRQECETRIQRLRALCA